MILVDGHVHIHSCHELEKILLAAFANFTACQPPHQTEEEADYVLLLAESKTADAFSQLRDQVDTRTSLPSESWRIQATAEDASLLLTHRDWPNRRLFIFAGRQLVTVERLELLALATKANFPDGLPIEEAIPAVQERQGMALLPWGVGKWLGGRGKLVSRIIAGAESGTLFIGDNGGRPVLWPAPHQFSMAARRRIGLLPGTDPLPLPSEAARVGSYGAMLPGTLSDTTPAADFKNLCVVAPEQIEAFGLRIGLFRFLTTQMMLRLQK
jgi:hypothetical protein